VSLILEALKKLEREKAAPERGFLVVAQAPWAGGGSRKAWLAAGGVLLVAVLGVALWKLRAAPTPPTPRAAASVPAPAPSATVLAPIPAAPVLQPAPSASPAIEARRATPPPEAASGRLVPPVAAAPRTPVSAPPALAPPATPAAAAPAASPAPESFRLEAVSEQDGVAVAIINGELVHEGDHLNGALVVRISPQEVELDVNGQRRRLTF